jgi:hypothetical protein
MINFMTHMLKLASSNTNKIIDASAYFGEVGGSQIEG